MGMIEPNSPLEQTRCNLCKEIHALGDTDCSGVFVGWIDEEGCVWESLRERDVATASGRWLDAFRAWNKTGGIVGTYPDPREFAERYCFDPMHHDEAIRECEEYPEFLRFIGAAKHQAQQAALN